MDESSASCELPILAVLFPVSRSAYHAAGLRHNHDVFEDVSPREGHHRLPSPASSEEGEDIMSSLGKSPGLGSSASRGVVLRQTGDIHSFKLGSDPESFFILSHPRSTSEDLCWINGVHCYFYHDPDSPNLWLKNSPTSPHVAPRAGRHSSVVKIEQGESAPLGPRTWDLDLGKGLKFRLEVQPSGLSPPQSWTIYYTPAA